MKVYFIFASAPLSLAFVQVNTSASQLSLGDWVNEPYICKDLMRQGKREHLIKRQRMASVTVIRLPCYPSWSVPVAFAGDLTAWQGVLAIIAVQDWSKHPLPWSCWDWRSVELRLTSGSPMLRWPQRELWGRTSSGCSGSLSAVDVRDMAVTPCNLTSVLFKFICFELQFDCPHS